MPDKLTKEELAAIAAFPKDRIQRVARGQSAIPITGINPREGSRIAVKQAARHASFRRSRKVDEEIRELWAKGLTDDEISRKVKLKPKAVYMRRYRMDIGTRSN